MGLSYKRESARALFDVVAAEMERLCQPDAEEIAENYAILSPMWKILQGQFPYADRDFELLLSQREKWKAIMHWERMIRLILSE